MLVTIDSTGYSGHCLIYGAAHHHPLPREGVGLP
jgi:hypothetical protein